MRMDLRRTFLLVTALLLLVFTPGMARAQDGTITGVVKDAKTGNALPNANVEVKTTTGTLAAKTLSNADGRYRVAVPAGTYNVSVQIVGYSATTLPNVSVSAGGSTSADASMGESA